MLSIEILLTYVAACIAVIIVPGPSVTVIIANSMRYGTRAGLWTDGGTQAGLATMLIVLAAGLSTIINHMGWLFRLASPHRRRLPDLARPQTLARRWRGHLVHFGGGARKERWHLPIQPKHVRGMFFLG